MKPFFMSGTSHHQPLQVSAKPEKAGQSCYKLLEAVYFNCPCMLNCYRCLSQVSDLAGIIQTWKPVAHKGPIACCEATCHFHHVQKVSERERERECHNLLNLLTDLLESSWCIAWQVKTNSGPHNYTTFHFDVKKLRIISDRIWPSISVQELSLSFTSVDFASRTSGGSVRTRAKTTLPPKQPQAMGLRDCGIARGNK